MKSLALSLAVLGIVGTATFSSCYNTYKCESGKGKIVTQTLDLEKFSGVGLQSSVKVFLSQGKKQQVEVKGHENHIELLKTKVKNGQWSIDFEKCIKDADFEVYISIPELDRVSVAGSGEVIGKTPFEVDDLDISVAGSGDVVLNVDGESVDMRVAGSGDISVEGKTKSESIKIAGSGDVKAGHLETDRCKVSIAGSGDASVHVNQSLTASIAGSGDINYSGNAKDINTSVAGSGDVNRVNR